MCANAQGLPRRLKETMELKYMGSMGMEHIMTSFYIHAHTHTQIIDYLRISECFAKAELSLSACAEPRSCGYWASKGEQKGSAGLPALPRKSLLLLPLLLQTNKQKLKPKPKRIRF